MLSLISFLLTVFGGINWLMIGLLQYDVIAGFFGFQSSIFSRLIYISFGISACYLVIKMIVGKGKFKIYERRKKKENSPENSNNTTSQNEEDTQSLERQPAYTETKNNDL